MARIRMKNSKTATVEDIFSLFIAAVTTRGVKDKTITTYRQHFRAIAKRLDVSVSMVDLTKQDLDNMIFAMREDDLSERSISSYTRTHKVFFSWCNEEGHTALNIHIYKAGEAAKDTYTDEELLTLLKKPKAGCNFCEFRNWAIINFLMNSGCRASTVRHILIRDVDISRRQIMFRHTKNGKIQVIPLCSAMASILREYLDVRAGSGTDYLFCNEFGEHLSENALRLAIAKYNRSRGITKTSVHMFRHTFAYKYLVDCGGDAFMLQKLMGHSTLKMTRHYCNIFNADIVESHEQHSPLAQMNQMKRKAIKI